MRNRSSLALALLLTAFASFGGFDGFANRANATIHYPEIVLRAERPAEPVVPGEIVRIPLTIYIRGERALDDISIDDRGAWSLAVVQPSEAPAKTSPVPPGYRVYHHTITGRPDEDLSNLSISVRSGEYLTVEVLSLKDLEAKIDVQVEMPIAGDTADAPRLDPSKFSKPDPAPGPSPVAVSSSAKIPREVRVHGRIQFSVPGMGNFGADGVTVRAMKPEFFDDTTLGLDVTDVDGYFDFTFMADGPIDVYMKVQASNSAVNVGTGIFFRTYERNYRTMEGFTGTDIFSNYFYATEMNQALWVVTALTRANRWYANNGYTVDRVNVRYPDNSRSVSWYMPTAGLEGIHLTTEAVWRSGTIYHEYGHHFVNGHATQVSPPFYCNDLCDYNSTCGHCRWCEENEAVAWSEGFPHFLAYKIGTDHSSDYGWDLPGGRSAETIQVCGDKGTIERSWSTEGIFFAYLQDLIDSNSDQDRAFTSTIREFSELSVGEILAVATIVRPSSSENFVRDFRNHLQQPTFSDLERREAWAAARMNGFESDGVAPTPPTSIMSSTHAVDVESPSNMPQLSFSGATDDHSGVAWYRVLITADTPGDPTLGFVVDVETSAIDWPVPLAQGSYYANVASVDRAGNQSTSFSYGPMLVGPPTPVDFEPVIEHLWEAPLVLRNSPDAVPIAAVFPPELLGNSDVWFNAFFKNTNPSGATAAPFRVQFIVDGRPVIHQDYPGGVVSGFEEFPLINLGPLYMQGGYHQVTVSLDSGSTVAEDSDGEENNLHGERLVFRPQILAPGAWQAMPQGPFIYGGLLSPSLVPNMDAVRIVPANKFAAVQIRHGSNRDNYDLRLFAPSSGHLSGFDTELGASSRDPGRLEGIVMNTGVLPYSSFDAGTVRHSPGGYDIRHVSSSVLVPGGGAVVNWSADDHLSLFEFTFNLLELGPFSVTIDASFDPGEPANELLLLWMDKITGTLTIDDIITGGERTDETGRATLDVNITQSGTHCLIVYRDAVAGPTKFPVDFTLTTTSAPLPDFSFFWGMPWEAPFLPSPIPTDGIKVEFPLDLAAGLNTYLNFAIFNDALVSSESSPIEVLVDGASLFLYDFDQIQAGASAAFAGSTPVSMSGGRHTLSLVLDPQSLIPESGEANNIFAMQWGWSGTDLFVGDSLLRAAPPSPDIGLEDIQFIMADNPAPDGEDGALLPRNFVAPNCDGLRFDPGQQKRVTGNWAGVAVMPGAGSNVDLRLHEAGLTPAEAFVHELAVSDWDKGLSDFVLMNFNLSSPLPFDIGVINTSGNENYTAQAAQSELLGVPADHGNYGPFTLDPDLIFGLYEFDLDPGDYQITLTNATPGLGFTIHAPLSPASTPYHSKSDVHDVGPVLASFPGLARVGETLSFTVYPGEEGAYCLAVWKESAAELSSTSSFELFFGVNPAPPQAIVVDGTADPNYGNPLSIQGVQTDFGDNDLGLVEYANGSELDQAFAFVEEGVLYLMLTGNLETNYNDLEIFFDTKPGGQNRLRGDNPDVSDDALNRMGDDGGGNGLSFDSGFEPDYYITVTGGDLRVVAYMASLPTTGGGVGRFLGATSAASGGRLVGPIVDNPFGVRMTIDNSNTQGVDGGTGVSSGQGVVTGVEFAIPLGALGYPPQCVQISAFVNGIFHDFVSNQVLGPVPVGTSNLGEPRNVDFSAIAGSQTFEICLEPGTAVDEPLPDAARRFVLYPAVPNPFNPSTTISFSLERQSQVDLAIYDVAGRRVRSLRRGEHLGAGTHAIVWDGTDNSGRQVASGSYLVRMRAGSFEQTQRLTLLK